MKEIICLIGLCIILVIIGGCKENKNDCNDTTKYGIEFIWQGISPNNHTFIISDRRIRELVPNATKIQSVTYEVNGVNITLKRTEDILLSYKEVCK